MIRTAAAALGVFTALSLGSAGSASASTWELDGAHVDLGFSVKHMMISDVRGRFNKASGVLELDDKDITKSSVKIEIDTASVDTNEPKRDGHLKGPDFFEVEKFPKMTFKSKSVSKAGANLKVVGDLTIKNVTKEVTLEVELSPEGKDPWGNVKHGVNATGKINREDFGLTWNKALEAGGVLVGKEVKLTLSAEFNKKK